MALFGTAGIRGGVPEAVDVELAADVGCAAARLAREAEDGGPAGEPTFVVGRDGRVTGEGLADAVAAGLRSGGADVTMLQRVSTPVVAFASQGQRGIAVTASHNPPWDNGLKLFVDGREYPSDVEAALVERLEATARPWDRWGGTVTDGSRYVRKYRAAVVEYAEYRGERPEDLTVVVDVGNGVTGSITPVVLGALGARVLTLDAEPAGTFPSRPAKPTRDALERTRAFVADSAASIGFAHDGDGDRIVVLDGDGEIVHEDTILAILAHHYVQRAVALATESPPPVVITTPNASARVDERVRAAGGRIERTALGTIHEGVAAALDAGSTVAFAGEPWKHCHPGLGDWLDGTATAAVLTRLIAADGLAALIDGVQERPYRKESVDCPNHAKPEAMRLLGESLPAAFPTAEVDTEYGIRLTFDDGSWLLCRPSGTEEYLRLYVESNRVDSLLATARETVEAAIDDAR